MSFTIGFAGKGGVGKTTLAGLAIKYLAAKGKTPILAVDADSNANLADVLGVTFKSTLSDAREEMKTTKDISMTKDQLIKLRASQAMVEDDDFDLIVMGQPEGSGCYCAANSILTLVLETIFDNYPYLVIDNEAGMEHISRLTAKYMDVFFVVTDASRRGLDTAIRIWNLVDELKITIKNRYLILNRVRNEVPEAVLKIIAENNLILAGTIPDDMVIYETDQDGGATSLLAEETPAVKAAFEIFSKTINK